MFLTHIFKNIEDRTDLTINKFLKRRIKKFLVYLFSIKLIERT